MQSLKLHILDCVLLCCDQSKMYSVKIWIPYLKGFNKKAPSKPQTKKLN